MKKEMLSAWDSIPNKNVFQKQKQIKIFQDIKFVNKLKNVKPCSSDRKWYRMDYESAKKTNTKNGNLKKMYTTNPKRIIKIAKNSYS